MTRCEPTFGRYYCHFELKHLLAPTKLLQPMPSLSPRLHAVQLCSEPREGCNQVALI